MKEQLSLQRRVVSGGSVKAKSNARTDVLPIGRSLRRGAGDRGNKHEGHFSREKQSVGAHVLGRLTDIGRAKSASAGGRE